MKRRKGFTLIELLVVIAIIALLLSIIMPALNRVKEAGKRAVCVTNQKSLALSWTMYAEENDGKITSCAARGSYPNGTRIENGWTGFVGEVEKDDTYKTTPIEAPVDMQINAIKYGLLYDYNEAEDIYQCPVAKKNEMRTYSCSVGMRGRKDAVPPQFISNVSEIRNTGSRIVFLDDYGQNWDAQWMINDTGYKFWNPIPARHGKGTTVSFADTHAEWWDWKDRETIEWASLEWQDAESRRNTYGSADNQDLVRIIRALFGKPRQ